MRSRGGLLDCSEVGSAAVGGGGIHEEKASEFKGFASLLAGLGGREKLYSHCGTFFPPLPRSSKSHPPSSAPFCTACPTFSLLSFPLPISLLRLPYFKARKKSPSTAAQETRPSPPPPLPPRPRPSMHVSGPLCIQQSGGAASPLFLSPISRGISWGVLGAPLSPPSPCLGHSLRRNDRSFFKWDKGRGRAGFPSRGPLGKTPLVEWPLQLKEGGGEGQNLPLSELPVLLRKRKGLLGNKKCSLSGDGRIRKEGENEITSPPGGGGGGGGGPSSAGHRREDKRERERKGPKVFF